MAHRKVDEESTFRTCRRCRKRFLSHYFKVCDECRKVVDDVNCYMPSQGEIALMCSWLRQKHMEDRKDESQETYEKKGRRGLDENNIRCYAQTRMNQTTLFEQGEA